RWARRRGRSVRVAPAANGSEAKRGRKSPATQESTHPAGDPENAAHPRIADCVRRRMPPQSGMRPSLLPTVRIVLPVIGFLAISALPMRAAPVVTLGDSLTKEYQV